LIVHAIVGGVLVVGMGRTVINEVTVRFMDIGVDEQLGMRQQELPPLERASPMAPAQPRAAAPAFPADSGAEGIRAVAVVPRMVPVGIPPRELIMHDPVIGSRPEIGSSYGTGRLWVGPLEGRLGVVGPSTDAATHVARVDSAIRAKILAFIDTMPPDSFATPPLAPWVTEIDGKKWGIDGTWLYLGDLKLPSAILALLPISQGNYYQAKEAAELQAIREQIIRAARQSQTNADFRRYVREIRERKDAEREERLRAQSRDTIPP
jgi:hypothetical protein